jgi:non-ribosomal peptide synthetase component F
MASGVMTPPIAGLSITLPREQRALRRILAAGRTAAPAKPVTLPGLFEAQASRTPDAVAVVCPHTTCADTTLTYAGLDQAQLIVALIAVLKAGATCLPVDPGYPQARIGLMLSDAQCATVLTASGSQECLPPEVPRVVLDDPVVAAGIAARRADSPRDADRTRPLLPPSPA